MDFSLMIALIVTGLVGCGSARSPRVNPTIGQTLTEIAPLYLSGGAESPVTWIPDYPSQRILRVNVADLRISGEFPMKLPDQKHSLLGSASGSYALDFSRKHFEVIRESGGREGIPLAFQGTPTSAAFSPGQGILVMEDDLDSLGFVMFDGDGNILDSYLFGPFLGDGKSIVAGDIGENGRLVLALSDKSVIDVDVEASIDQQEIVYESFDTGITGIVWLAPDSQIGDFWLAVGSSEVALIDMSLQKVVDRASIETSGTVGRIGKWEGSVTAVVAQTDQIDAEAASPVDPGLTAQAGETSPESGNQSLSLSGSIFPFKVVKPHILHKASDTSDPILTYISSDGVLVQESIPGKLAAEPSVSILDGTGENLRVLSSTPQAHTVSGMRLKDHLVLAQASLAGGNLAVMGEEYLFVNRETDLGYFEAVKITTEAHKELKGYNFDFFRQNPDCCTE